MFDAGSRAETMDVIHPSPVLRVSRVGFRAGEAGDQRVPDGVEIPGMVGEALAVRRVREVLQDAAASLWACVPLQCTLNCNGCRVDAHALMRALVFMLLFTLLPLQLSTAAVAVYCGPAAAVPLHRLGHHEHAHDAESAESCVGTESGHTGIDPGCDTCHTHGTALFMEPASPLLQALHVGVLAHPFPAHPAHLYERPYRPKWAAPADRA